MKTIHTCLLFRSALVAFMVLGASARLQAAEKVYGAVPSEGGGTGVTFQIGYSLGTHQGSVSQLTGTLKTLSTATAETVASAHFSVPIASMKTGDLTRDCHMRESLGIDYAGGKATFPKDHVCGSDHQLPASGPDAIAFPVIEFDFKSFKLASGAALPSRLEPGKTYAVRVLGKWTLHGKTREFGTEQGAGLPLLVQWVDPASGLIRISGQFDLLLSDFDVKVMAGGPLGIVKSSDHATVVLDLRLKEQAAKAN